MNKRDLVRLYDGLGAVGKLKGIKFVYAVARNRKLLEPEVMPLQTAMEPDEKFVEFEQKRIQLCERLADKTTQGTPIRELGSFRIIEHRAEFDKALAELRTQYKDAVDGRINQEQEYEKMLDEEVEGIKFHKIKMGDVPSDITAQQLEGILEVISE